MSFVGVGVWLIERNAFTAIAFNCSDSDGDDEAFEALDDGRGVDALRFFELGGGVSCNG